MRYLVYNKTAWKGGFVLATSTYRSPLCFRAPGSAPIRNCRGGGGGIRTLDTLRYARFPSACTRPLCDPSRFYSSTRITHRVSDPSVFVLRWGHYATPPGGRIVHDRLIRGNHSPSILCYNDTVMSAGKPKSPHHGADDARFLNAALLAMLVMLVAAAAFLAIRGANAAGGGGGGYVAPTCTADEFSCTAWGACSSSGTQTRTCTMSYDCPSIVTPPPGETQSCTPPSPPPPSTNTNTAAPAPKPAACTSDTWTCTDWSKCDIYGNQLRSCNLTNDCSAVQTPAPEVSRRCPTLQCDQSTLAERVTCRLHLAPAGLARELEIQYLPELCRTMTDPAKRTACIAQYKAFGPCWAKPVGEERFSCARGALALGPDVAAAATQCGGDQTCIAALRDKVYALVRFRFYDLEERAEDTYYHGITIDQIASFVVTVEQKKIDFTNATSAAERRQIILDVRDAWQTFVAQALPLYH